MAEVQSRTADVTPVAAARNWQKRVRHEMDSNKQWEANWGFLVKEPHGMDSLDQFTVSTKTGTKMNASMIAMNKLTIPRDTNKSVGHDESLDEFVHVYMLKHGGQRPLPQKEFKRPMLTSHTLGWGKNLEMFGDMKLHLR